MTNQPQISVLTTCYNREKYLAECIQSVLNSHFEDFELIIVDDGSAIVLSKSPENSPQVIHEFASTGMQKISVTIPIETRLHPMLKNTSSTWMRTT